MHFVHALFSWLDLVVYLCSLSAHWESFEQLFSVLWQGAHKSAFLYGWFLQFILFLWLGHVFLFHCMLYNFLLGFGHLKKKLPLPVFMYWLCAREGLYQSAQLEFLEPLKSFLISCSTSVCLQNCISNMLVLTSVFSRFQIMIPVPSSCQVRWGKKKTVPHQPPDKIEDWMHDPHFFPYCGQSTGWQVSSQLHSAMPCRCRGTDGHIKHNFSYPFLWNSFLDLDWPEYFGFLTGFLIYHRGSLVSIFLLTQILCGGKRAWCFLVSHLADISPLMRFCIFLSHFR